MASRAGRHRLVRRIGRGGMGEVFLARYEAMPGVRKLSAVKLVREDVTDEQTRTALLREARLVAFLTHPNVVQLLDAGFEGEHPWIAMEYVPGVALSELLRAAEAAAGALPHWVAARIVADACSGLDAIHDARDEGGRPLGIVHRDVSPHNVLVAWDGSVKVTDLGVARSVIQSNATTAGVIKGKLSYMAPEQALAGEVDRRADVFALGVVLWEALAGRKLFSRANEAETLANVLLANVPEMESVRQSVPAALSAVATRALAREPSARFQTAGEMRRELERAMRDADVGVGATEVAAVVAQLLRERVREHERWLDEAAVVDDVAREAADAVETVVEAGPTPPRRTRVWASLAVVAALVASGAAVQQLRTPRSAPSAAASVSAVPPPEAPSASTSADVAAAAVSAPEPPAPSTPTARSAASTKAPEAFGLLNVGSRPRWSTVRVDGRNVGQTPVVDLRVRAGAHTVEALPEGRPPAQRRMVTVGADDRARVVFDVGAQ